MAPARGAVPSCGFVVNSTKKGELPLKVEKRAKGKKVTIIGNVSGDATKLARGLQSMLGVGGSVRQVEKDSWAVEVQGEQVPRVTKALLDFQCLRGLSATALEAARSESESKRTEVAVERTAATKFLAQTKTGAAMSPEEERKKMLEMEAEFYGRFWSTAQSSGDIFDVFEDDRQQDAPVGNEDVKLPTDSVELNIALQALGLLAECGSAVRDFWQSSGMTLQQFRKMALNPGARLIGDGPGRKVAPSNLKSRQKLSDWRGGGSGKVSYFSPVVSAIDSYERGKGAGKAAAESQGPTYPEAPALNVEEDEEGWCRALLSYCVPLAVPPSRLEDEERQRISKQALRNLQGRLSEDLAGMQQSIQGISCHLDCSTFGLDLSLSERDFLQGHRRDTGKAPSNQDKDEMRLEKKLREICSLKRRQVEGEQLDKLQAEKVAKRGELFRETAELKLRRAEKEIPKLFKRHLKAFQDSFWELEWQALYGAGATASTSSSAPFGIFDEERCEGPVTLREEGARAESSVPRWVGAPLHLHVKAGEVSAFAVEVLEGLVRLGWAAPGAVLSDLGSCKSGYGFGSTGKKVSAGIFEAYGSTFGPGDTIHCEAEREEGRLRIGFAKNNEPLGVAFDTEDTLGEGPDLVGVVSGKGFKVRLISAETLPLEEAPVLQSYVEYDPPRLAEVVKDFQVGEEENLLLWTGETVYVSADDGEGWCYGFFLDPEDPDDGGWFPADAVRFLEEAEEAVIDASEEDVWDSWAPPAEVPAELPQWGDDSAKSEGQSGYLQTPAPQASAEEEGPVPGLDSWLAGMSLLKYSAKAAEWCAEMGAVSLEEIEESWEDFAEGLALKPLERKRLQKAVCK